MMVTLGVTEKGRYSIQHIHTAVTATLIFFRARATHQFHFLAACTELIKNTYILRGLCFKLA